MADNQAYRGAADPSSSSSDYNLMRFIISGALAKVRTVEAVQVVSCTNDGGLVAAGTVDVLPLVNQLDGYGQPTPHKTIFKRPYLRWQGGPRAVILDPVAGDIGLLVCCDRDTSVVLNTLAQANPGSARRFDFADGFYIQAVGKDVPTSFLQFTGDDINLTAPGTITVKAGTIVLDGPVQGTETADFEGDVTGDGISLAHHTHGGVQTGGGNTGEPNG